MAIARPYNLASMWGIVTVAGIGIGGIVVSNLYNPLTTLVLTMTKRYRAPSSRQLSVLTILSPQ